MPRSDLHPFALLSGKGVFPTQLPLEHRSELMQASLPLPCARIDRPEGLVGDLLDNVLRDEKIELREIRVKYPRDSFFSKGTRRVLIRPERLTWTCDADDLYPGQKKMTLEFGLPRGSYATILVKRITDEDAGELE